MELDTIRSLIEAGEKSEARQQLRELGKTHPPNADLYYYAALLAKNAERAQSFLDRALALDPLHAGANRLDYRLKHEGFAAILGAEVEAPQAVVHREPEAVDAMPLVEPKLRQQSKRSRRALLMFMTVGIMVSLTMSYVLMLALGAGAAIINPVSEVLGGEESLDVFDGINIDEIENPARLLNFPVAVSAPVERGGSNAVGDILRVGVLHEYTFDAYSGEEIAVAVQFFSPLADNVIGNVAVLDPNDYLAGSRCERQIIIDRQTGAAYICQIDVSGAWRIRIFGREGESSGVYVVTTDRLG